MITFPTFRGPLNGVGTSYLVSENFEQTGIQSSLNFVKHAESLTSFGYLFNSDSPSPVGLQGSGCLRVMETGRYFSMTVTGFAPLLSGESYFLFNPSGSLPSSAHNMMFFLNEEGAEVARLRWSTAGAFSIRLGGSGVDIATSAMATGFQTYHVWFTYKSSSGFSASSSVAFSTNGIRPNGGTSFASRTGESTGKLKTFRFSVNTGFTATYYIDKFRLSEKRISNYPS